MKEKIAENLYHISAAARYGADFPKWETLKLDQQDFFRKKADTLVLTLLKQEIEKVGLLTQDEICKGLEQDLGRGVAQAQLGKVLKILK